MAKSRAKRCRQDDDLVDKLKRENAKLKQQYAALRRVVDRIDLERYHNLKDLVDRQREEQRQLEKNRENEQGKRTCFECGKGVMILQIFPRRDGDFYYRACNLCDHRTKMKKYHKDVEE